MKRGFEAVLGRCSTTSPRKPLGELLKARGHELVMNVGGASGPALRHAVHAAGQGAADAADGRKDAAAAFAEAIEAVKARGKSDVGQKTMLDVLGAGAAVHAPRADAGLPAARCGIAARGREATVPMKATAGAPPSWASARSAIWIPARAPAALMHRGRLSTRLEGTA